MAWHCSIGCSKGGLKPTKIKKELLIQNIGCLSLSLSTTKIQQGRCKPNQEPTQRSKTAQTLPKNRTTHSKERYMQTTMRIMRAPANSSTCYSMTLFPSIASSKIQKNKRLQKAHHPYFYRQLSAQNHHNVPYNNRIQLRAHRA